MMPPNLGAIAADGSLERESGLYWRGRIGSASSFTHQGNVAAHDFAVSYFQFGRSRAAVRHGIIGRDGQQWPITDSASPASSLPSYLVAIGRIAGAMDTHFDASRCVFFIAFFAAGAGMFTLSRSYFAAAVRVAAAVIYALNPYHLITVVLGLPRCRDAGERRVRSQCSAH